MGAYKDAMTRYKLALEAVRIDRLSTDGSIFDPEDQKAEDQLHRDGFLDARGVSGKTVDLLIKGPPRKRKRDVIPSRVRGRKSSVKRKDARKEK